MVKVGGRIILLKTEEIEWIEADDKYLRLHAGERSHLVRITLSAFESQLDPRKFLRIHRSAIVNIDRIKKLRPMINGEYKVLLESGVTLTLSRNYRNKFYDTLGKPV
jgi:two-component system LytT family response regulator